MVVKKEFRQFYLYEQVLALITGRSVQSVKHQEKRPIAAYEASTGYGGEQAFADGLECVQIFLMKCLERVLLPAIDSVRTLV